MASSSTSKTIRLQSSDGRVFVVSEKMMTQQSATIRRLREKAKPQDDSILLNTMDSKVLAKVIEYCYAADAYESYTKATKEGSSTKMSDSTKLQKWEQNVLDVDEGIFLNLIFAAHFLEISKLIDATSKMSE